MTSHAGCNSQETHYARRIHEVLAELRPMQQPPRLVTSPAAREA
jgi:hypothetical protein